MIKVDCAVCGMPLDPFDLKPHKCLSKENPMKPHKHAELIKAWADGAEIECKNISNVWVYECSPAWFSHMEYRIKPEPKPDGVRYYILYGSDVVSTPEKDKAELKLTFDGETGELKSAEVLK